MPVCKRYIVMDSEGEICGPCMKTEELCWQALRNGYERSTADAATTEKVKAMGYRVVLCTVEYPKPEPIVFPKPRGTITYPNQVQKEKQDYDIPE